MVLHDESEPGQSGTSQSRDPFLAQARARFNEVEIDYWPQVRWWLPEGVATDRTLDQNLEEILRLGVRRRRDHRHP